MSCLAWFWRIEVIDDGQRAALVAELHGAGYSTLPASDPRSFLLVTGRNTYCFARFYHDKIAARCARREDIADGSHPGEYADEQLEQFMGTTGCMVPNSHWSGEDWLQP